MIAADPAALIARLEQGGFNATRGRAFAVVESDAGVAAPEPVAARALHERVVFLPFSPEMPERVLARLARIVREEAGPDSPGSSRRADPGSA